MTAPDTETRLLTAIADAIWCLEHDAPLSACAALRAALGVQGYDGATAAAGRGDDVSDSEHYLVVHAAVADTDPDWSIEHTAVCPQYEIWDGVFDYSCSVGRHITEAGLDAFGTFGEWPEQIPKIPGRYPIEAWFEEYYSHYYGATEYDAGLRIIEEQS